MKKELLIHWTTDNYDTAMNMVLLYVYNSKKTALWDETTLMIRGASQNLVRDDAEIAGKVKSLNEVGVRVIACQHCAKEQGTRDTLESCDIEVFSTGVFLTEWIQSGKHILTI